MKILIADDHAIVRRGLKEILLDEYPSAIIAEASDAEELLKKAFQDKWDLVISDLNMPGKNGYDVISDVKANPSYSHIPVIITSTSSTRTIIDKCLALGAADYIVKPETFVEYVPYVKKLHRLIEEKQLVKQ